MRVAADKAAAIGRLTQLRRNYSWDDVDVPGRCTTNQSPTQVYTLLHREGHPTRAVASSTSQVKHGDNMVKKSNKKRRYPTSAGHAAHAGVDAGPYEGGGLPPPPLPPSGEVALTDP